MSLLDLALGSVLGGGRSRGRGRSPVVNALLLALAAKAVEHFLSQRRAGAAGNTGLGDILGDVLSGAQNGGGLAGSGGLGKILDGLGGAGALDGLLEKFTNRGQADRAQSWVGTGANAPLAPQDVADALDDDDLEQLSQEVALPKADVVRELAAALPDAIDHLTPNGRLPSEVELQNMADELEAEASDGARGIL